MGDKSAIEWTDATWNPTVGCEKVSEGCRNCYAIRRAHRNANFPHMAEIYEGLTRKLPDGSLNWTGEVRMLHDRLEIPLRWKRPRRIFVDSMSDLFHEQISSRFIGQVFGIMAACPEHTFQVLTKRPGRMRDLLPADFVGPVQGEASMTAYETLRDHRGLTGHANQYTLPEWPLPNVWLGTSVEDQPTANWRIPFLMQTPAAVRFISAEPLLGPIDLAEACHFEGRDYGECPLDWVIAGGESGPGHRPLNLDWVRQLRDQCRGTAFLFKQVGGATSKAGGRELDGRTWDEYPDTKGVAI